MAVDATSIKARFREFACLDDDVIDRWLDEAVRGINATQWAGRYDDGLTYLTAHLIATFEFDALGSGEPGAGPVTSESEGGVSYSLVAADMFRRDSFGGTRYGRRYREILSSVFVTRCL